VKKSSETAAMGVLLVLTHGGGAEERRQWRRDDALGEWEWEWLRRAGSEGTAAATETAG
jgi:hypothetical protein